MGNKQGHVSNRDTDKRIGNKFNKKDEFERRVVLPVRVKAGHLDAVKDFADQRNVSTSAALDDVLEAGLLSESIKNSNSSSATV